MRKYLLPLFLLILFTTFSYAQWSELEEVPSDIDTGGAIAYGGGYVWCIVGDRTDDFLAYDINESYWEEDLEYIPEMIDSAGAIAYDSRQSRRIFVAANGEIADWDQLFVYTKYLSTGWEGEWNISETGINRIFLPDEECGPGVSLAFQPVNSISIAGWLYLLKGGRTKKFYRMAFPYINDNPFGFFPPEDSQISKNSLVFDWEFVNEATKYQFQLAKTTSFDSPIIDTLILETEFNPPIEMLENGIYYWRIRFKRNLKRYEWSAWSRSMKFILANSGRPRVVYSYPSDKSILATNRLIIDWEPARRIVLYQAQIDNDSSFFSPIIDTVIDKSELGIKLVNGKYWWRYRFLSEGGQWSGWSRTSSFELQQGWEELPDILTEVYSGGALCFNKCEDERAPGESLFAFVGNGNRTFYCYSIGSRSWGERTSTPMPQNDGSSITRGRGGLKLFTIFGISSSIYTHYNYNVFGNTWSDKDELPEIPGAGASITCNQEAQDAYLVIGGGNDGFYINRHPSEEEEGGSQSTKVIPHSKKSKFVAYPDRFEIHYSTSFSFPVKIQVYNFLGERIKALLSEKVEKGEHQVVWDKTDNFNRKVAAGVYIIAIDKENKPERLKVIIR